MRKSHGATENQMPVIRNRSRSSASEITRPSSSSSRSQSAYESATLPKRSKTISEPHGQRLVFGLSLVYRILRNTHAGTNTKKSRGALVFGSNYI